jgi:uncharacterized membrane protein (DUF485 family)
MKISLKYKSRKFLVTLWAIIMLTILPIWAMAQSYSPEWLNLLLPPLALIVGAFIGVEGLIDKANVGKNECTKD